MSQIQIEKNKTANQAKELLKAPNNRKNVQNHSSVDIYRRLSLFKRQFKQTVQQQNFFVWLALGIPKKEISKMIFLFD